MPHSSRRDRQQRPTGSAWCWGQRSVSSFLQLRYGAGPRDRPGLLLGGRGPVPRQGGDSRVVCPCSPSRWFSQRLTWAESLPCAGQSSALGAAGESPALVGGQTVGKHSEGQLCAFPGAILTTSQGRWLSLLWPCGPTVQVRKLSQ